MNHVTRELERLRAQPEAVAVAARAFAERAESLGLIDIAYGTAESPLGTLLVAASPRGLLRLAYDEESFDDVLSKLSRQVSPRVVRLPQRTDAIRKELDDYFDGRRRSFEVDVDLALARGFGRRVLESARSIPYGQTASYGEVAASAGNARAVRAAGTALGRNPVPIVIPCHRVIRRTGALGGYTGGLGRKEKLLELEGASPT